MSVAEVEASYEELAEEAPEAPEEAPVKRKPGRPPGSKNKPKTPPPPEPESVTPAEPVAPVMRKPGRPQGSKNKPKNPPQSAEPESVTPAAPKEPQESQLLPVLDVEFDEGPGGAGPPARPRSAKTPRARKPAQPVRLTRSRTTGGDDYDLLHYVAEAARAYGAQERLKRQDFYNRYLPIG